MATEVQTISAPVKKNGTSTVARVFRYTAVRAITLFITVVIAIYMTILIANMGGYVDQMMRGQVTEQINMAMAANPAYKSMSPDTRKQLAQQQIDLEIERLGLNKPLAVRTANYLINAITLNLGRAQNMVSDTGSKNVKNILLERMPWTLLLLGISELLLFFVSLFLALSLSRQYGSFWDKLVIALTPTSSAPAWFYGIFLILIFAAWIRILPFGGLVSAPPPKTTLLYALSLLQHMILPALSLFLSGLFLNIYSWRTFFLIYSSEDYVDMAKAKGLTGGDIEKRYILRPTLPTIITTFALTLIGVWGGAIVTETIFQWPGLGNMLYKAIGLYDTPVIVGDTIIYAYLLAITVFVLDFVYVLVDPRVKLGEGV
ncbi:MAG TPA: ABC transporter permease [Longilinea sp.]|nr:ABC transporter permease [Longilinea sp.]